MRFWFERLPVRAKLVLLAMAIVLPVTGVLAWLLAEQVREARDAAYAKVKILASSTAGDVERRLRESEGVLGRLAERPLVKALDPSRCDPIIAESVLINPEYTLIAIRDLHSNIVCANLPDPIPRLNPRDFPWFEEGLRAGRFQASNATLRQRTGRWVTVLSHPIRDAAGAPIGLIALPVDLLRMSQQLLASTPKGAVVSVIDRDRAVLLRSIDPGSFIGTRPNPNEPDPARGLREGFLSTTARDGVRRLVAFVTIPGLDWRVAAGLPEAEVFAEYHATLRRTVGMVLGVLLLAIGLAWRVSATIVRPIAALAGTAARIGTGDTRVRAEVAGPAEIASVAQQFNRMLDSRDASEAALRESEARLRRLLTLLPEAVFVDSGNRISFVNEAARRLFGADESALLGRSPLDLYHPDSIESVKACNAQLYGGASDAPLTELRILRADGAIRFVESARTLIADHGETSILVIMRDVTELRQARLALERSHADLQRLVAAQDKVQENERKRIAREIHDDLQQTLAAIRIDLVTIGERVAAGPASVAPILAEAAALAASAIDSTRRIVNDLRPQMLEDLGLVPALEALTGQFSQRTGIVCDFEVRGQACEQAVESPAVATCLYRVAQEALNNVAKHAGANAVHVQIDDAADGWLVLRVSDNGTGTSAGDRRKPDSFGLLGMYERVRALGGTLRIDSEPGAGTTVEVTIPATASA